MKTMLLISLQFVALLSFGQIHKIGEHYGGGIIFYILQPGDKEYNPQVTHGLIAAPSDQSEGIIFGCQGTPTYAFDKNINAGKSNTKKIITKCDGTGAAYLCSHLALEGYTDWYLPSIDELSKLYINKDIVGGFMSGSSYWSSNEWDSYRGWLVYFANGTRSHNFKNHNYYVRAIRSF